MNVALVAKKQQFGETSAIGVERRYKMHVTQKSCKI